MKKRKINLIEIYSSGAVKKNPGFSGIGFIVYINRKKIYKHSKSLKSESTKKEAEFVAIYKALNYILKKGGNEINGMISLYSDSKNIVRQLNGYIKIENQSLLLIYLDIQKELDKLKRYYGILINFKWIPKKKNTKARELAKTAIFI